MRFHAEGRPIPPDYGIDAPGVVRGLAMAGLGSVVLACWARAGFAPAQLQGLWFPGASWLLSAAWMTLGSSVFKLRMRDRLIGQLQLGGHEQMLDVGTGRGMMLHAAAAKLSTGRATGIDLWRSKDQSGNTMSANVDNAKRLGVDTKLCVLSADMRELPFGDGEFDVVLSSFAVHNIDDAPGRAKAVGEMWRVLKPGGRIVIADMARTAEYAATLRELGAAGVRRDFDNCAFLLPTFVVRARKA